MTEDEWLTGSFSAKTIPSDRMLELLRNQPGLGRKRRLLAVACCNRVMKWMPDECLPAVAVAERLAEGPVDEEERWAVYNAAGDAKDVQITLPQSWAGYCAYRAAGRPTDYERPTSFQEDYAALVAQTAAQPAAWVNRKWDNAVLVMERRAIADLIRDIFGNPFRPVAINEVWLTPAVVRLAQSIYDERAFDRLRFLADTLENAGCEESVILDHCRQPGPHVRGCWVVDLVLGRTDRK